MVKIMLIGVGRRNGTHSHIIIGDEFWEAAVWTPFGPKVPAMIKEGKEGGG